MLFAIGSGNCRLRKFGRGLTSFNPSSIDSVRSKLQIVYWRIWRWMATKMHSLRLFYHFSWYPHAQRLRNYNYDWELVGTSNSGAGNRFIDYRHAQWIQTQGQEDASQMQSTHFTGALAASAYLHTRPTVFESIFGQYTQEQATTFIRAIPGWFVCSWLETCF